MRKLIAAIGCAIFVAVAGHAAKFEQLKVKSPSMGREIPVNILTPDAPGRYPVAYLLHGHGSGCEKWITIKPELEARADSLGLIIVMPTGDNSWYWDSPVDPSMKFETFISKELVDYVDSRYPTVADSGHRFITGLSMGGQGSLWNAVNHPDVFGTMGSLSGGVDITFSPESWNIKDALGPIEENRERWESFRLPNRVEQFKDGGQAIIITCGTEDFFFGINEDLHKKLLDAKVPHHYITSPGGHTDQYWAELIDYHLLFFLNNLKNQAK